MVPSKVLAIRGGATPTQLAAGVNGIVMLSYGSALVLNPSVLAKNVMDSDDPPEFSEIGYAFGQYLGCAYLAQAMCMVRALWTPATAANDLMGITLLQALLCLTSLARLIFGNLDRNPVTLTLPMGQGLMAALALWGVLHA